MNTLVEQTVKFFLELHICYSEKVTPFKTFEVPEFPPLPEPPEPDN